MTTKTTTVVPVTRTMVSDCRGNDHVVATQQIVTELADSSGVTSSVANNIETVSSQVARSTVVVARDVVSSLVAQQGPPGQSGSSDGATAIYQYGETISALKAVVIIDDQAFPADSTDITHRGRVAGITESAALAGNDGTVRFLGGMSDASWNWTGPLLFVGSGGALVEIPPSGFSQAIARVESSDAIFVNPFQPIERA